MDCIDAPVSITLEQMLNLVDEIRNLENIIGDQDLKITDVQNSATIFRRKTK